MSSKSKLKLVSTVVDSTFSYCRSVDGLLVYSSVSDAPKNSTLK